jgi:hypothetical protein
VPITLHLKRLFACLALVTLAHSPLSQAAIIGLDLNNPVAANGDSVTLDITVSGLGDFAPDSLGAFDVTVDFDALALSFDSYVIGDYLGDLGLTQAIDSSFGAAGGSVNIAEISLLAAASLDALQPEEFVLASINFDVLDLGAGVPSVFSLAPGAILADAGGASLPANSNAAVTLVGGSVVPLPGTLLLFLSGMMSWMLAFRVRRLRQ